MILGKTEFLDKYRKVTIFLVQNVTINLAKQMNFIDCIHFIGFNQRSVPIIHNFFFIVQLSFGMKRLTFK